MTPHTREFLGGALDAVGLGLALFGVGALLGAVFGGAGIGAGALGFGVLLAGQWLRALADRIDPCE